MSCPLLSASGLIESSRDRANKQIIGEGLFLIAA